MYPLKLRPHLWTCWLCQPDKELLWHDFCPCSNKETTCVGQPTRPRRNRPETPKASQGREQRCRPPLGQWCNNWKKHAHFLFKSCCSCDLRRFGQYRNPAPQKMGREFVTWQHNSMSCETGKCIHYPLSTMAWMTWRNSFEGEGMAGLFPLLPPSTKNATEGGTWTSIFLWGESTPVVQLKKGKENIEKNSINRYNYQNS